MPWIPHTRMTTHFSLGPPGTVLEEATCTLNFISPGIALNAEGRQNAVNDAFGDWAAYVVTSAAKVSNSVQLDRVTLYMIGSDGLITEDPAVSEGAPVRGTGSVGYHPWQCSQVLTLVAGARGKGRLGRIYLPPATYDVTQSGSVSSAHHIDIFNATQLLMNNLSNRAGPDLGFALAIAGQTGTGTLREVTELRMGKVIDTQRRRRRNLNEAYSIAAFSA